MGSDPFWVEIASPFGPAAGEARGWRCLRSCSFLLLHAQGQPYRTQAGRRTYVLLTGWGGRRELAGSDRCVELFSWASGGGSVASLIQDCCAPKRKKVRYPRSM